MPNVVDVLITWTPYLAVGFGWNILVSLVAMAIGTAFGIALAAMRGGRIRRVSQGAGALTMLAASAPTFVMLFYLAYMVPGSFAILGTTVIVPVWLKASLALSIAVAGFVSDNAYAALRHLRRGQTTEALLFLPSWTNYFLIIVMASATASVIGVPEMVFRVDTVIAALGQPQLSFWIYLYAMGWFLAFAGVVALVMRFAHVRRRDASNSLSRHLIMIVTASVGLAIISVAVALGLLARNTLIDQAENQARMVAGLIVLMVVVTRIGFGHAAITALIGILIWVAMLKSGVHATIAGVIFGLLMSARPQLGAREFAERSVLLIRDYRRAISAGDTEHSKVMLGEMEELSQGTESPLERLERLAHPWSSYVILPIFAFANAGLHLSGVDLGSLFTSDVTVGVMLGLLVGKVVGITLFPWLASRFGIVELPRYVTWTHVIGTGFLGGIGFTMAIFITGLAFSDPELVLGATAGIMCASAAAGLVGYSLLRVSSHRW